MNKYVNDSDKYKYSMNHIYPKEAENNTETYSKTTLILLGVLFLVVVVLAFIGMVVLI